MSAPQRIRAVFFDMDGTIVDGFSPILYGLNKALEMLGKPAMTQEEVVRHTGKGEGSIVTLFGERREEALAFFHKHHDEYIREVKALEGASELLQWLHERQIPVAIVTSKSQVRAEIQLEHLGWMPYISAIVGLLEGRRQKPDPHTLHLACEALHVDPTDAIMVGDGTADMKAAIGAGSFPVGLAGGFSSDELQEAGAAICFDNLKDVHTWLTTQIN